MKDEQRQEKREDRVEDLDVREDEAREVAGGKEKERSRGWGRRVSGRVHALYPHRKER